MAVNETPIREATCACGQLKIRLKGDPVMVSACCCQQCQKRTGALMGVQAFFAESQVEASEGTSSRFQRIAESGNSLDFSFCPKCGSTVWWRAEIRPGTVSVAVGAFADADFPAPQRLVWAEHRHPWVVTSVDLPLFEKAP